MSETKLMISPQNPVLSLFLQMAAPSIRLDQLETWRYPPCLVFSLTPCFNPPPQPVKSSEHLSDPPPPPFSTTTTVLWVTTTSCPNHCNGFTLSPFCVLSPSHTVCSQAAAIVCFENVQQPALIFYAFLPPLEKGSTKPWPRCSPLAHQHPLFPLEWALDKYLSQGM